MSSLLTLTSAQLKHAASLKDQIAKLEKKLTAILGSPASQAAPARKGMSAAARAKIAAAQKARWAKVKKSSPPKKKSGMSAAGRARIAAAQKARWAKVKAAGKSKP
jgi:hypothetical protein